MKNRLILNVSIPRSKSKSRDPRSISVAATSITLGEEALRDLGISIGDYIMVASFGKDLYFAKRPPGFPGYKVAQFKKANRGSFFASDIQKDFRGLWELAETIEQDMKNDGNTATVRWKKAVKSAVSED